MTNTTDCLTLRRLSIADEPMLWTMLMHAAHESSLAAVHQQPLLRPYVEGWGRAGDLGWLAQHPAKTVGAAWCRCWTGSDQGYGYVDSTIPELAIAVLPPYCGQGIGSHLLAALLADARHRYTAISLSVRGDNPARQLYERFGFTAVKGSEVPNRVGGTSLTMRCPLASGQTIS
ncbi:MAG: GNAT family N-acetyltransferase [Leptolyngbyaceae cyanobacterium]